MRLNRLSQSTWRWANFSFFSSLILTVTLAGCRADSDGKTTKVSQTKGDRSAQGVVGFVAPGKGFNNAGSDVMANYCVVSGNSPQWPAANPPTNTPTVDPTFPDPAFPDTTDDTPAKDPKKDPPKKDPKKKPTSPFNPFDLFFPTKNNGKSPTSETLRPSLDAEIVELGQAPMMTIEDKLTNGTLSESGNFSLDSQAGSTSVRFYFLNSVSDVHATISASYSNSSKAEGSVSDKASGSMAAQIEAELTAKYGSKSEFTFILIHGAKDFPILQTDTVTNPEFNLAQRNLVFGGANLPKDKALLADSWRRMIQTCGDHFVEYVKFGREMWMVAAMDKKVLDIALNGGLKTDTKGSVKYKDAISAENELKTALNSEAGRSIMNQKVDIMMFTRGRNDTQIGKFTLDSALDELNKFLTAERGPADAVAQIGTRDYNSVKFKFDTNVEMRGGDIFTREIKELAGLNTDVFAKIRAERNWAAKEIDIIWTDYGWEQWSLLPSIYNGVALQYIQLNDYLKKIDSVFAYCGSQAPDSNSVSNDCMLRAKAQATVERPGVNLPAPLTQRVMAWMPPAIFDAAFKKNWGNGAGEVTLEDAKKTCSNTPEWFVADEKDWQAFINASYFYTQWQKYQNPGYKADDDKYILALPCGAYRGGIFWGTESNRMIKLADECVGSTPQYIAIPKSQVHHHNLIYKKNLARFACVKYTSSY